ncbi:MAG: hypothetical protein DRP74_07060 [Candidatus Omnitrophota bacterium]|nr:MAG: hypothetical protein DRP74_07060 [Candidatus Omnitrophota bacterium]
MKDKGRRIILILSFLLLVCSLKPIACFAQSSAEYVKKAWAASGKKDFDTVYKLTSECIKKFSELADTLAATLNGFPPKRDENHYRTMNDVATCYFIKAETLMRQGKTEKAKKAFRKVIAKYPWAQNFDPRGWYWSIKEKAEVTLKKLETGKIEEENEEEVVITKVKLYDAGTEFPVDYSKYGKFQNVGTKDYRYKIEDPIGLAKAVGEGIYPNSTSLRFDPEFVKIKKDLYKIDHWEIANSRDLSTAFYKWNVTPEHPAVKQFTIASILEKSGLIKQAVKAYYSILVHYPRSYGWTYWHTPWYIARTSLYRIKHILKQKPELGLKLKDAEIQVINGYDNNIRNDTFIVNPGKLVPLSFWDKKFSRTKCGRKERLGKYVIKTKGEKIQLVKYKNGHWQLLVEEKPFVIKGITYGPTRVGESPDDGTIQNWTTQDLNNNGLVDSPFEAWVDKNRNNVQDEGEEPVGDFKLIKEMGVNAIRLYHQPFELNKEILRQMHQKYGIYIIIGDFLGKYALGSGADWEQGTDYDNPVHKENMLASVKKMVTEFKDEPYILMWLLGNENVYGLGCNADKKPKSFFKFTNEAAKLVKSLDPYNRPVAIASGDTLFLDIFAKNCPEVDIFGTNSYRGKYGFLDLWDEVKRLCDKPAMITEYGASSYAKGYSRQEAEQYQADYHKACWEDILCNSAGLKTGISIGGIAYEWVDEWWKAYEPTHHDKKGLFSGPFLDGYMHEEWLGLTSQGDGMSSPYLRQLKKSYYTYKELWN